MARIRHFYPPRRARAARLLAACAAAAALAPGAALADDYGNLSHRSYILQAPGTDAFVADVAWWSTEPGAEIVAWYNHGGANQQWELERRTISGGDAVYAIKSRHSGLCLSSRTGAITQQNCSGDGPELWRMRPFLFAGTYTLESVSMNGRYLSSAGDAGTPMQLATENTFGIMWRLNETKLPYSVETPGVSVGWGAIGGETAYCDKGWRVERDAGTDNPRYNYLGDGNMTNVWGSTYEDPKRDVENGDTPDGNDATGRRISMNYYNIKIPMQERTGRTRFFCQPA